MFVIAVHFSIKPDHIDAFRQIVIRQAINSKTHEPGCLQFDVCEDPAKPGHFFLYELYTNPAAFDAHKQTPHFTEFSSSVEGMIESKEVCGLNRIEPAA